MSATEREISDEPDFSWGKKLGVGGKKKDLRFYESFTFDGVEYALYDCVYLFNKQDEEHPHIGKLIKIWQSADKSKNIRVQWFFRASEISHWLRTHNVKAMENELFFATGEGFGLSNVNPVETIVGKCFVVCISRDSRNPQPSAEQLQMADYVFYRTFDVDKWIISDKMDERIGKLEVKYLFNKQENEMIIGQIGSKPKEEGNRIAVVFEDTSQLSGNKPHQVVESMKSGDHNDLVAEDFEVNYSLVKPPPVVECEEEQIQDSMEPSIEVNVAGSSVSANEVKVLLLESDTRNLGGCHPEKVKPIDAGGIGGLSNIGKDSSCFEDRSAPKPKDFVSLDDRPPKKPRVENLAQRAKVEKKKCVEKPTDRAKVEANNHMEKPGDGCSVDDKRKANIYMEKLRDGIFIDNKRKAMLDQNSPRSNDGPSKEDYTGKTKKVKALNGLEKINTKGRLEQKVGHDYMNEVTRNPGRVDKIPLENSSRYTKSPKELNQGPSSKVHEEKIREHAKGGPSNKMRDEKMGEYAKDSFRCDGPSKKRINGKSSEPVQGDLAMVKRSSVGAIEKGPIEEKLSGKTSMPINNSFDDSLIEEIRIGNKSNPMKASIATSKGLSMKKLDITSMRSDNNSKIFEASHVTGKTYEVTPRPNNGKGWFTSNDWDNFKDAHDEGRVILLQNFDPEYTSGEIEDILWSAFKERCTAKMVVRTVFSSTHYGQALVILRTREAAERVVGKLNDGCLLISNERALVASIVNLPQPTRKRNNFVGHLLTNKMKLQMQREKRDAVSTAHYSQPNTMEYEMALEWCLLQSKYDFSWKKLNELQGEELSNCMAELKSNAVNKK